MSTPHPPTTKEAITLGKISVDLQSLNLQFLLMWTHYRCPPIALASVYCGLDQQSFTTSMADTTAHTPVFIQSAHALTLVTFNLHKKREKKRMWRRQWVARSEVMQVLQVHAEDEEGY